MHVSIDAQVSDDLKWVQGNIRFDAVADYELIDPLKGLPEPEDDTRGPRTFPGPRNEGQTTWGTETDGSLWFRTILPQRLGDVGTTHAGLFANGAWYPQPLREGQLVQASWDVTVQIPTNTAGALGDVAGRDTLHWEGEGERASLAVVRHGHLTRLQSDGVDVTLLTQGPPRYGLRTNLENQLPLLTQIGDKTWTGVIAVAPLRRRLARPGVGMTYLSQQAWRTLFLLWRLHHVSTMRGIATGFIDRSDPVERQLVGAWVSEEHANALVGMSADKAVKFSRLVPAVDSMASDGDTPFYGDIFEMVHETDLIRDDLLERFGDPTHGAVVFAQLTDRFGKHDAGIFGESLFLGATLAEAAHDAAIPMSFFEAWRSPYPVQDYTLELGEKRLSATVTRHAPPDAQVEMVTIAAGDERLSWLAGPGPDETTVTFDERPKSVRIDPKHHVLQTERRGDLKPSRYLVSVGGGVSTVVLNPFFLEAYLVSWIRRRGDTHNLWILSAATDRENWASISMGFARYAGPLLNQRRRPHRFGITLRPSLLNPNFAALQGGRFALGGDVSYTYDNRAGSVFPTRGIRYRVSASAGFVPENLLNWFSVESYFAGLLSLHPRHVFALRFIGGFVDTSLNHRLLPMGGPNGMRSIPPSVGLAKYKTVMNAEYRTVPIRNVLVPHLLGWIQEVQFSVGVEAGVASIDGQLAVMTGITTGATVGTDIFGVIPFIGGITLAWPLYVEGIEVETSATPTVYLRAYQEF